MAFGLNEIFDKAKLAGATPAPLTPQTLSEITILPNILKNIEHLMETKHSFDWTEFNAFGTGEEQTGDKDLHMGSQDALNLATLVRNMPLKEFIAKSGAMTGAGLQGANYLIPVKIYDLLVTSSTEKDICSQLSAAMLGPAELPGTTCNVDIVVDESFHPMSYSSGGKMPESNLTITQATLDFSNAFGLHIPITNDLIEDQKWGLMELSLRTAGQEMGEKASDMAFTALYAAADGDGTVNQITGDQAYTEFLTDNGAHTIEECIGYCLADGFVPDTFVLTHHAMQYNIFGTSGAAGMESDLRKNFQASGWPTTLCGMNVIYTEVDYATVNQAYTTCRSVVFAKPYSMITGRKRWLRIENYSDPIQDLVGSTISSRQDSVTLYKDAIAPYIEGS